MPETTYTLDEARAELARQECRAHGHDYEHIETARPDAGRDLTGVFCPQCRRSWPIAAPGQQPADAEQGRAEERAAIARMVRSHFAAVDDPLYEDVRILCERIERGEHLPARTTEADQPAAEPTTPPKTATAPEMRCSECGRPLVDQPCGLVHAFARMQIAAIRMGLSSLLKRGGHA
ncbi:hypothetical protein [Streptosporangium sp. NPDC004631]